MKLSEFETEVLEIFWQVKQASAPEMHELVCRKKEVSYSTVKTIVDRLEKKGAIGRLEKQGRTIIYHPVLQKDSFSKPLIKDFIKRVLGGSAKPLLNQLFNDDALDDDDIKYLENLIEKRKKQRNKK